MKRRDFLTQSFAVLNVTGLAWIVGSSSFTSFAIDPRFPISPQHNLS